MKLRDIFTDAAYMARVAIGRHVDQLARAKRWSDLSALGLTMHNGTTFCGSTGLADGLREADDITRMQTMGALVMATNVMRRMEPHVRLRAVRELVDERMKAIMPRTRCRGSGCSACCHQQVVITDGEARDLAKQPHDADRMAAHARLPQDTGAFTSQGWSQAACPYLASNGHCRAYHVRPLACRMHSSIQDPRDCDWSVTGTVEVASYNDWACQIAVSALYQFEEPEPMAHAVTRLRARKE